VRIASALHGRSRDFKAKRASHLELPLKPCVSFR
jgi:hypothetical protein